MIDIITFPDDFLAIPTEKINAIKICDNNPHVLIYVDGLDNPFRIKHPDKNAEKIDQSGFAVGLFTELSDNLFSFQKAKHNFFKDPMDETTLGYIKTLVSNLSESDRDELIQNMAGGII
jgi:hypothetical protein